MLEQLKNQSNMTTTENGGAAYRSTGSDCLDLFSSVGAMRASGEESIIKLFVRAYAENPSLAMKILFFARDVRGGLGERKIFRTLISYLANNESASLRKNLALIPEYGRYDDLLSLLCTPLEGDALELVKNQLDADISALEEGGGVSLLAKWLPSVNTSNAVSVYYAKRIARALGYTDAQYRKILSALRRKIHIIENNLRERDYSFNYEKQPSRAMLKYRAAFIRNDCERYSDYIEKVRQGSAKMNTSALAPYDIISPCFNSEQDALSRAALSAAWGALEDFGGSENALAVIDGSGSMYWNGYKNGVLPIAVAISLGMYFAEHNRGKFKNHFITFSENPRLVEIKGGDIYERVKYCMSYNEVANTNIQKVFELILNTAVKNSVPKEEMPARLYIISDMEFDACTKDASLTAFEYAKKLYNSQGYELPEVVFWNVASRNSHQPVKMDESGVALVSGCTPRLFEALAGGIISPYEAMLEILFSERYKDITA